MQGPHKKHELQQKLETSQSFYNDMLKADENYKQLKAGAHYTNLTPVNQILVSKFQADKPTPVDIYFVYGIYINQDKVKMQVITQYFVTVLPKPKKPYIFVYFNDFQSPNNFNNFKNMLSIMPVQYFINLQALYLVRSSLRMKATRYFTFGTIAKYINNKTINVDSIQELSEKIKYRKQDILKFLPMDVRSAFSNEQQKNMVLLVPHTLNTTKSSGQSMSRSTHSPTNSPSNSPRSQKNNQMTMTQKPSSNIEKSPMVVKSEISNQPNKLQIDQYDKGQRGVPEMFQVLLHYFRQHNHELQQQGIFRKSVNIQQQTTAIQKMNKKQYDYLQKVKDPHLVANLIKRFLSKLKTPIIPYNIFNELMQTQNLNPQFISQEMKKLSSQNLTKFLTLMVLLDFLLRKVIPRAHKNKMPTQNIAICFAPCLMWAQQRSIKDLTYISKSVAVVILMLNNFEPIFGNQKDINKIFRSSYYDQQKKSILEAYNIEQIPTHTVSMEEQRRTPNFGLLILQKTNNQIKRLEQHSDDSALQDQSLIRAKNNMKVNVLSPGQQISPNKSGARSHIEKNEIRQEDLLMYQKKNQRKGSLNKLQPNMMTQVEPVRGTIQIKLSEIDSPKTPGLGQIQNPRISSLKPSNNVNQMHSQK